MRIAVVCPYDLGRPGGVQQQCAELVQELRARSHDAWLVGPGRAGPAGSRLLGPTVPIPANRSVASISVDPRAWPLLRDAVRGAHVLHIHEPLTPMVSWAALRLRYPAVGTFHADPPTWLRRFYRATGSGLRRALRLLTQSTAVSPVAAAGVEGLVRNVELIPNGISCDLFGAGERQGRRVAFLGRDEPRKGLSALLIAWSLVTKDVPDAELVVMGATRQQELDRVRFLGPVDANRKRAELSRSDVLCAPNLGGESFGIVLAEGMASGCAIVTSDLPGFRDTVGDAGRFVAPGDSDRLAAVLTEVLRHPEERSRLQEAGRRRAKTFDWSLVVPAYEAVYTKAARRT